MAETTRWVAAPPETAFSLVADPASYALWVVGAAATAPLDERWPAPGARFAHRQGTRALVVEDTTTVTAVRAPRMLRLLVHARPWFVGDVELRFEPEQGGTRITLRERRVGGLARFVPQTLLDPLLRLRNAESVRRLAAMAWARHHAAPPAARAA
ncbi:MAG: SRPBCC family protein [Solirubrobacteraceae bacterium]|jgi:uncharacterized protein YndB with AHSA1/START domain|nr:SRPBCC family protein [Solirubrobacteraceae bacterium]